MSTWHFRFSYTLDAFYLRKLRHSKFNKPCNKNFILLQCQQSFEISTDLHPISITQTLIFECNDKLFSNINRAIYHPCSPSDHDPRCHIRFMSLAPFFFLVFLQRGNSFISEKTIGHEWFRCKEVSLYIYFNSLKKTKLTNEKNKIMEPTFIQL